MKKQNKYNDTYQKGFIALFFILGISFTFLTWISLSSERVFEYITIKNEFINNRSKSHNIVLCGDAFINIFIKSKYNLSFINQSYQFERNLYHKDNYLCEIKSINTVQENNQIKRVFFIINDFSFEYQFKNGFVKFISSSNIL